MSIRVCIKRIEMSIHVLSIYVHIGGIAYLPMNNCEGAQNKHTQWHELKFLFPADNYTNAENESISS